MQAKREGVNKKEVQSGGGWFGGWFGSKQAPTEIQTVGRIINFLHCYCEIFRSVYFKILRWCDAEQSAAVLH